MIMLVGLRGAVGFYTPTAVGYVQLPGIIIASTVACWSVICFLSCPRRPITPKLIALALASFGIFCTLYFLVDYCAEKM